MVKPNYAIKPTPEQALRTNRTMPPARLIAALAFVPDLGRVLLCSGWCWSALVGVAEARWVVSVEKQSRAKLVKRVSC